MYLLHSLSIKQCKVSVNASSGFLFEVSEDLRIKFQVNPRMSGIVNWWHAHQKTKDLQYCPRKYIEFVEYGNILLKDSKNIASEALLLMLAGVMYSWKCAIL